MSHNISGLWNIAQDNGHGATVYVLPPKPDGSFGLDAYQPDGTRQIAGFGTSDDNRVHFTIYWNNGTAGAYDGAFEPDGHLAGATYDLLHPESHAGWRSDKAF